MWSKFSSALKPSRQLNDNDSDRSSAHSAAPTDVLSRVYEQHPNLSVFHEQQPSNDQPVPFPTPSPPPSPSKRKKSIRLPKINTDIQSSSLRLPLGFPKKVRSHLHLKSAPSLSRNSTDTARPSTDTYRQPSDPTPRPSIDTTPFTPGPDPKYNSVRSILRDPKTPGTGQNVRFFSRDAYKLVSPDTSASTVEHSPTSVVDRIARATRLSAMEVFSPPLLKEELPPDQSNLFDVSPRFDLIPMGLNTPIHDNAIELQDDNAAATSTPFKGLPEMSLDSSFSFTPPPATNSPLLDGPTVSSTSQPHLTRNRSRAVSDTVFQSMLKKHSPEADINDTLSTSLVLAPEPDPFRANATTYYTPGTMIPPTPPQSSHTRTASREEDIIWNLRTQLALHQELCAQYEIDLAARDELVRALTLRAEAAEKDKEKGRNVLRTWKKKASELERMCRNLEEEVDTSRQESMERSVMDEASGEALRMLHRQISQLEREKDALQTQADVASSHSHEGVNELNEDALRAKEHELREKDAEMEVLRAEMKRRDDAEHILREGIRDAKEQMDHLTSNSARSSMTEEAMIIAADEDRERHQTIELAWAEEQVRMLAAHQVLEAQKNELAEELQRTQDELARLFAAHELLQAESTVELQRACEATADSERVSEVLKTREHEIITLTSEYNTLKAELEAQWRHTERASDDLEAKEHEIITLKSEYDALKTELDAQWRQAERASEDLEAAHRDRDAARQDVGIADEELDAAHQESAELRSHIEELQGNNDALKTDIEALETKILSIEEEWSEGENRRAALQAELVRATEDHESRIDELTAELAFERENVSRLQDNIKERDTSIASLTSTVRTHTDEVEALREEISALKVEHSRSSSSQTRAVQDLQSLEKNLRNQLEVALRERAESDIRLGTSKERVSCLMDEVARLRRTVHEMQQESAAREVTIVQLRKERERDREDANGLNIALDSKQQELELIKRKIAMKNAATTPSTSSTPAAARGLRREPSLGTPSTASRPPSSMSDASKDGKLSDTPSAPRASISALSRSIRVNAATTGKMGPPAPKSSARQLLTTPTPSRTSLSASTTRAPPSLGKSTTMRPGVGATPRRVSASSVDSIPKTSVSARRISVSSSAPSEIDEKENLSATPTALKPSRRMLPA